MAVTFNGETLTITLESGITEVDVQGDLYEEWKTWMLSGNMRYPAAFRTIGGDPLSAIINAGSYFFLQNNLGWRIKPPEEDITVYLTGNLAVEDTSLPAFIPTTGEYTAAILGLQPVTQGVTASLTTNINFSTFNGGIYWDSINGKTNITDTEIDGNEANPLKNISDVLSQAILKSFIKIYVIGSVTIGSTDNVDGYILIGEGPPLSTFNFISGASTLKTIMRGCHILGSISGAVDITDCHVEGLYEVGGTVIGTNFTNCILEADTGNAMALSTTSTEHIHIVGCNSGSDNENPATIDCNGSAALITITYWGGALKLKNITNLDQKISINSTGGELIIDSTCTDGTITLMGDITFTDNSDGAVTLINKTTSNINWMHSKALTIGKFLGLK